jgi:hypothetical protein
LPGFGQAGDHRWQAHASRLAKDMARKFDDALQMSTTASDHDSGSELLQQTRFLHVAQDVLKALLHTRLDNASKFAALERKGRPRSDFTHYHLIILEQGKLVAYDTITALLSAQQSRRIVIQTLTPTPALYAVVTHFNYTISVDPQLPTRYIVQMNGDDAAQAQLLKACIEHNIPVQQFASEANTLERTFLQVTAGLN